MNKLMLKSVTPVYITSTINIDISISDAFLNVLTNKNFKKSCDDQILRMSKRHKTLTK